MPNLATTEIPIVGNTKVTVPASAKFMTTYVLREQGDRFEDEITFVRDFIKPGMKAIDIGANYGLYTLSIANIAGDDGIVWAFEPTASTSACLRASISSNRFNNVRLVQTGLSDRQGSARLITYPNSELNSLSREALPGDRYETISLLTLDHCWQKYRWKHIDFIKLDAEGEEVNILKGGEKALDRLSPLIMFELRHGNRLNLPLIHRLQDMGYHSYRLIPGLNTLIPLNHNKPFDAGERTLVVLVFFQINPLRAVPVVPEYR